MVVACSNPSASAGNNAASPSTANPGTAPAATVDRPAVAPDNSVKPVATVGSAAAGTAAAANAPAANAAAANAAAAEPAYREITLPAGTVLPVDLETSVGSDISRVEQAVHARLRRAVTINGVQVLPAGTAVSGHVTAAERPGRVKGRGYVAMRFNQLDTPGAGTTRISTATISRTAPATKKQDAAKIGVPAAAGAVIGGIVGGGDGVAKGAAIGGAAGTGYVLSTRGKEVRIGKGADLSVRLTAPVTIRVRT